MEPPGREDRKEDAKEFSKNTLAFIALVQEDPEFTTAVSSLGTGSALSSPKIPIVRDVVILHL